MYTICLWAISKIFDFQHRFYLHMWFLINWDIWDIGCKDKSIYNEWKKLRFQLYLELDADICLELHLKIYYKSYISFVCEQFKNFLIFSIEFIFICDFWSIEIYILGLRIKRYGWVKKATFSFAFGFRGRCLAWNAS